MRTTLTESKRPRKGETPIAGLALPKAGTIDYFHAPCPGLCLRASHRGSRTWYHFYRSPIDRKLVRRKLGPLSLADAIEAWRDDRKLLRRKVDPNLEDEARVAKARADRAAARTFRDAVDDYYKRYQVGEAGNSSADQVRDMLKAKGAAWLDRRVDAIGAAEIGALVEGYRDDGHPYGANLLFRYLHHFFRWCARPTVGYVARSPMEGMEAPFKKPEPRDRWYAADEVAALWRASAGLGVYERAFLRVLLLTGKRKRALRAMRRDEVGADGWWRPTGARSNGKKLNLPIPLPAPALRIVRDLAPLDENPYVFASLRRKDQALDPGSPLQRRVQAASGVADFYWHACRDTIATHLKKLGVPGNAARRFTDHAQTRDAHERAYTHDEMLIATEDAAETWGRFVKLVAARRVWAKVSAHLAAADVDGVDARRRAVRERDREFRALIQAGGEPWSRWVRSIARPAKSDAKVVKLPKRRRR